MTLGANLLLLRVLDQCDELVELISHLLGGYTSGSALEVLMNEQHE